MNWNEWRNAIVAGSPVVIGGVSHTVDAVTEWVTLRAPDGTTRRMPLRDLANALAKDDARRRLSDLVKTWEEEHSELTPGAPSRLLTKEETERLVRAFLRYRGLGPGAYRAYSEFAAWVTRVEHGAKVFTEREFLRALHNVYRQDPTLRLNSSTSQIRKGDAARRMSMRPGQSLSINVTISIVDRTDGHE